MDAATLRSLCLKFTGTTEDIKWEDHLCFCVAEKMFLFMSPDQVPVSASFKVNAESFDELISRPGIKPAPYLSRYKWVFTDDIRNLQENEWASVVAEAYRLIASKLPASKKKELGLAPS